MQCRRTKYINQLIIVILFEISLLTKLICNKSRFLFIFSPRSLAIFALPQAADFHLLGRSLFPATLPFIWSLTADQMSCEEGEWEESSKGRKRSSFYSQ